MPGRSPAGAAAGPSPQISSPCATIDVSYRSEPVVGFLVPGEMRERYDGLSDGVRIEGTATYSRFRRFQVVAEETIDPGASVR